MNERPMRKESAGLLLYKRDGAEIQVLLAHPGGPFWAKKDKGAWTLPKGLVEAGETPLDAAIREFTEETGFAIEGEFLPLGAVVQRGGKHVEAWAVEGECDPADLKPFMFQMEWPPKSGRMAQFPEIDRVAWFSLTEACEQILPSQLPFIERLGALLAGGQPSA
jgi:predicted NUDIX family NTP pyrophosphohydrolase